MDKWEYLFAEWSVANVSLLDQAVVIIYIDRTPLPVNAGHQKVIRLLGEDGWELAAMGGRELPEFVFKRPWTGQPYDVQSLVSKLEAMAH